MENLVMIWRGCPDFKNITNSPHLEFWLLGLFAPLEQISVSNCNQTVFLSLEAEVPLAKSKWFAGRTARKFMHWASCTRSREHTILLSRSRQRKFDIPAGNKGRRTGYLRKHNSVALSCASVRVGDEDLDTLAVFPLSQVRGHPSHWPSIARSIAAGTKASLFIPLSDLLFTGSGNFFVLFFINK